MPIASNVCTARSRWTRAKSKAPDDARARPLTCSNFANRSGAKRLVNERTPESASTAAAYCSFASRVSTFRRCVSVAILACGSPLGIERSLHLRREPQRAGLPLTVVGSLSASRRYCSVGVWHGYFGQLEFQAWILGIGILPGRRSATESEPDCPESRSECIIPSRNSSAQSQSIPPRANDAPKRTQYSPNWREQPHVARWPDICANSGRLRPTAALQKFRLSSSGRRLLIAKYPRSQTSSTVESSVSAVSRWCRAF